MLELVVPVEVDHRRLQGGSPVEALGEPGLPEGGRGREEVPHRADPGGGEALDGHALGTDAAHHLAGLQEPEVAVLVVHEDLQGDGGLPQEGREGVQEPDRKAVRIHSDGQMPEPLLPAHAEIADGLLLQARHLAVVPQEALSCNRGPGRSLPDDEHPADLVLQLLDALGDGGLGDEELLGGAGEASLLQDGGERLHEAVVEHEIY